MRAANFSHYYGRARTDENGTGIIVVDRRNSRSGKGDITDCAVLFRAKSYNISDVPFVDLEGESINRRIVSLLWYMPLFMAWQKDRVQEAGGDAAGLERAANEVQSIVERVLGIP
jgi:hypothetical protein